MACYQPLYARKIWDNTGKSKTGETLDFLRGTELKKIIESKYRPIDVLPIPCGKCIGCRLDYAKEWASRCTLEMIDTKNNYFVTLTYNDDNLVYGLGPTLVKDHLKKFLKDLRRYYEYHYNHKGIRFYACGEYGEQYERPHYHLIIYNLPIIDLKTITKTKNGTLWQSETIEKIWKNGFVTIAEANWQTAAYTARYMLKKIKGGQKIYYKEIKKIQPEFTNMSRMPGIGMPYYEKNKENIIKYDEIYIDKGNGVTKNTPPKYYDKLIEKEDPEAIKNIKEKRLEKAYQSMLNQLEKTDLTHTEYLKIKERKALERTPKLIREIEKQA